MVDEMSASLLSPDYVLMTDVVYYEKVTMKFRLCLSLTHKVNMIIRVQCNNSEK